MRLCRLLCPLLLAPLTLTAQAAHVVGEYHPPRTWAPPPHGFDLRHQRIAVSFDLSVKLTALQIWAQGHGSAATDAVMAATGTDNPNPLRQQAAGMLGSSHDPRAADVLAGLSDPVETRGLRMTALNALTHADTTRAAVVAARGIADQDPLYAVMAVNVLGRIGGPGGRATLLSAQRTETRVTVRAAIAAVLGAH